MHFWRECDEAEIVCKYDDALERRKERKMRGK